MHNFVYLAQRRSQKFSCEPNFGGPGPPPPLAAPVNHDELSFELSVADYCIGVLAYRQLSAFKT